CAGSSAPRWACATGRSIRLPPRPRRSWTMGRSHEARIMRSAPRDSAGARGMAMPIVLLMLMAALLLGMTAARLVQIDAQAARNGWDREIAFQAAEAALLDGERDVAGASDWPGARAELFHDEPFQDDAAAFAPGCGRGDANRALGLCQAPAWRSQVDALIRQVQANEQAPYNPLAGWVP